MPEARVELGSKDKGDPYAVKHLHYLTWLEIHLDTESSKHIACAGGRTRRPVAVLDDRDSRRCSHNRGDRGHVHDRAKGVSPSSHNVEHHRINRKVYRVAQYRVAKADYFIDGLRFRPQRHQEGGELSVRGLPRHDLLHRPGGLSHTQVCAIQQLGQQLWPRERFGHSPIVSGPLGHVARSFRPAKSGIIEG